MGLPGLRTGVRQFCCTARALRQTLGQHEFPAIVKNSRERHQIYVSKSLDPYLNLSIEHYLLRHSPDDARVLFLYVNRPCVVIGRNQNPWMEVDLRYIHSAHAGRKQLDLVRRRSGGGAVYHDPGNVNFSVICPIADFSRDKHAEMVVRGLRSLGVERARVNKRHDIVLDQGSEKTMVDPDDTHISPYMTSAKESRPRKISGSAYKLTRARALHHGTCLLDTNSISTLNSVFCAPGLPFIKARGVESVSSPVTNVKVSRLEFERTVTEQFCRLYSVSGAFDAQGSFKALVEESAGNLVGHELQLVPEIQEGYDELKVPIF
ncbi:MAG: Biotin/lipoate A/B protein ligase [Vezdaea aestivalis]|nr:MAG: Biotin/lipoate A/B protein ligase [Vezdaea aestivalis]